MEYISFKSSTSEGDSDYTENQEFIMKRYLALQIESLKLQEENAKLKILSKSYNAIESVDDNNNQIGEKDKVVQVRSEEHLNSAKNLANNEKIDHQENCEDKELIRHKTKDVDMKENSVIDHFNISLSSEGRTEDTETKKNEIKGSKTPYVGQLVWACLNKGKYCPCLVDSINTESRRNYYFSLLKL